MSKELRIKVVEVKPVELQDGKKFTAYKVLTKDGKKMDCKFRQEVKNTPTEPCIMIVDSDKCNVSANRQYPVLWVSEIKSLEEYEQTSNSEKYFE